MREELAPAELRVAKIAQRQHGVVTVSQLHSAGIEKSGISRRVRAGRLHRLHRGVYAVGHRGLSNEGWWMAAVLACGEGAVLSHRSAAALWRLLPPPGGPVDVSTPVRNGRGKRSGIRLHRCPSLVEGMTTRRLDIPVTTVARTIEDLRSAVPPWQWRRAIRKAEVAGLPLGPGLETDGTRSDLERDFLRLCRGGGLPVPEVNVRLGRLTVDFLWRERRLVVETDGYRYHRGRVAFQDDRARDLYLRGLGFEIRHFSERQINEEPNCVAGDLIAAFAAS
jgi:hypothetical protein